MKRPLLTIVLIAGATSCGFNRRLLIDRAAFDLSCPAADVQVRCIVGSHGSDVVRGCGRWARYTNTSAGPRLERIGVDPLPDELRVCGPP